MLRNRPSLCAVSQHFAHSRERAPTIPCQRPACVVQETEWQTAATLCALLARRTPGTAWLDHDRWGNPRRARCDHAPLCRLPRAGATRSLSEVWAGLTRGHAPLQAGALTPVLMRGAWSWRRRQALSVPVTLLTSGIRIDRSNRLRLHVATAAGKQEIPHRKRHRETCSQKRYPAL